MFANETYARLNVVMVDAENADLRQSGVVFAQIADHGG
jgi:hypothetical protein